MADTLRVLWIGHDGTEWDLLNPLSPVFAVSIAGMGMPGLTQQWTLSGARDGQRYEATQWTANMVTLTIQVGDTYTQPGYTRRRIGEDWRALDRQFRHSFSAEETGQLVVESGSGRRSLSLRLDDAIEPPSEVNPALSGSATYVLPLVAGDEPWWVGEEISTSFAWTVGSTPFFADVGVTLDPDEVDAFIAEDAAIEAASLFNPGDRAAYPVWEVQGPADEVRVGVGSEYVALPFSIGENQSIYVDSYKQSITNEAGQSLWALMGFSDPLFPPIPANAQAPLSITMIGAGSAARVTVTIKPRYDWPW